MLHYITSFNTPITPTVTNGASTKSFKFSECELKKVSFQNSQVSDVKSLALHVTSKNLVSLESGSIVEYVFPCFQLGKLDLGVT